MSVWEQLPLTFKRKLIGKLDYKSRQSLSRCSRQNRALVGAAPIRLTSATLTIVYEGASGNSGTVPILVLSERVAGKNAVDGYYIETNVIDNFVSIFKNRQSKVDALCINGHVREFYAFTAFIDKIIEQLEKLGAHFKIRAHKFDWCQEAHCVFNVTKVLGHVDEDVIDQLVLRFDMGPAMVRTLEKLAQWKRAKTIYVQKLVYTNFEPFLHFNRIKINNGTCSEDDIAAVVKSFISTPRPLGSFFQIKTSGDFEVRSILKKLDRMHLFLETIEELRNENFELEWNRRLILCVMLQKRQVDGTICRKGHILEDCEAPANYCI
ncbi:unnamed protein product [Caenorhabditis sp. 36 PRJEB53466]|nr:unnamed protein product [Caenorhabditis sp. 36 PRJEB53466]